VCVCVYVYIYIYIYMYVCMYVCMCVRMYICVSHYTGILKTVDFPKKPAAFFSIVK